MVANVAVAMGFLLLFLLGTMIVWWRLGVQEERERQKRGSHPAD
jgi:hypothetical protein